MRNRCIAPQSVFVPIGAPARTLGTKKKVKKKIIAFYRFKLQKLNWAGLADNEYGLLENNIIDLIIFSLCSSN